MTLYIKNYSVHAARLLHSTQAILRKWGTRTIALLKTPYASAGAAIGLVAGAYALYHYRYKKASSPQHLNLPNKENLQIIDDQKARPIHLAALTPTNNPSIQPAVAEKPYQLSKIDEHDWAAINRLTIQRVNPNHPVWTLRKARTLGVEPTHKLTIDSTTYYISKPFLFGSSVENSRIAVTVLVAQENVCYPRTFYLSQSQALWRYIPEIVKHANHANKRITGHIGKGIAEIDTNLPIGLSVALFQHITSCKREELVLFGADGPIDNSNSGGGQYAAATKSYQGNVQALALPLIVAADSAEEMQPKKEFGVNQARLSLEALKDFAPHFKSDYEYDVDSYFYGRMKAHIYPSKNGQLQYLFYEIVKSQANDSIEGQAFLAAVEKVEGNPILKYGNRTTYLTDFLEVTHPLFEYWETVNIY